jgi:uncharacterized phage protein gp47/JayE
VDFPTYQDLFRISRDTMLSGNPLLRREIVERAGTDANALTAAPAAVGDEVVGQLIQVQAGLFLDTSKREKLDRLIYDRYQLPRLGASPARTNVSFTLPQPAVASFNIPARVKLKSDDGRVYLTTESKSFPAGSAGPISVAVQSMLTGVSQQARVNTIRSIQDSIAGAPATLQVTNPLATAGGTSEESDEEYRERGRRFYATSRRGTIKAIERACLDVAGVRSATVFEALEVNGVAARVVQAVIADQFTEQLIDATVFPPVYQTQSAALAAAIQAELVETRAGGIGVSILMANVRLLSVTLALRFRAGSDIDAAATQARVEVVNYTNSLPPGAVWSRADANARLSRVPGLVVEGDGAEIFSPPGDVEPSVLEVLRTGLGMVVIGNEIDRVVTTGSFSA